MLDIVTSQNQSFTGDSVQ